jgi:hypothetical protein
MDNKHPKSEMPALKETAAAAKGKQGLDKSMLKEKKHHDHTTSDATSGRGPVAK